ncbi:hypothetical protein ACFE04_029200 [Oxalis oulophora]
MSSSIDLLWNESEREMQQNVPVVYYLSRNGQLDHPHFMEVPLSSPDQGLYLKDVINRLDNLRGHGFGNMYSWSSKRSYKKRFVWQDLSETDLIYPCNGNEYILKGSQLLGNSMSLRIYETLSSTSTNSRNSNSCEDSNIVPTISRKKNHSWAAYNELDEPKVLPKAKSNNNRNLMHRSFSVSTQTDAKETDEQSSMDNDDRGVEKDRQSDHKTKGSMAMMHLISCGSKWPKLMC